MKVLIRLFARARDLVGRDGIDLEMPPKATVGELRVRLADAFPALRTILDRCAVAVQNEFASDAVELTPDAEVAILPPVSGG
jgi:molybdopterin converting factor subunit 1